MADIFQSPASQASISLGYTGSGFATGSDGGYHVRPVWGPLGGATALTIGGLGGISGPIAPALASNRWPWSSVNERWPWRIKDGASQTSALPEGSGSSDNLFDFYYF